ncbi:methionine/alanine import family NSS transporter small subunit [Leucobacter massiliensis]|uniref:Methionine/alanine importer small subunit n=1 Tax=Leucobacter massiliensis TaxID=1686285 RepID=A0A2S9QMG0_9MICO|nr:methionine/alanine import family NSS transporter small subunit [Leucobacter massiliensis]PRI10786.1 hypothetical protein B4915_07755 [Leucobacter massiliensis]
MTPIAIVFLCLSIVIVWGGLVASAVFLARRPEVDEYPPGGEEADPAEGPHFPMRDT